MPRAAAAAPEARSFRPLFERWSGRVRARLALRHVLTGAAFGLLLGAGAAAALWRTRQPGRSLAGAAGGLLGAAVGMGVARRKRWPDADVALYLDARLAAKEAIATALELDGDRDGLGPAGAVVLSHAAAALTQATPGAVRARLLRPSHLALPVALVALVAISVAPVPPLPPGPVAPPGAEKVRLAQVAGLEKVLALADARARDEAQRERLQKLADDARKLRDQLRAGVETREAQAEIARLKDGITAERLSLGAGEQRQGMESALGKLGENPDLKGAQRALGDRDLVRLDDAMERLADTLEKTSRERALRTLEEAAEAAKNGGAPDVQRALEASRGRLAEQGKRVDRLRELARELGAGLGEDGQQALRDLEGSGSPRDAQRLAEKLDEALGKLTPEERQQLAENLKKKMSAAASGEAGPGPSKRELADLADELATPEGRRRLEGELKKMAEASPSDSEEGERQRSLDAAEEGAGEAEEQLGGGVPRAGGAPRQSAGQSAGPSGDGPGHSGHTEGDGPGSHAGVTGAVEGGDIRARAATRMSKGRPMPGVVTGRTAGKVGETANVQGQGALGGAAATEIGGVERSDVPEAYREQVGRYFQPR